MTINIDQYIKESLANCIKEGFIDGIPEIYSPSFRVSDKITDSSNGYIFIQYYYDEDYNRIFVEYELSKSIKSILPWELVVDYINDSINRKMKGEYLKSITYDMKIKRSVHGLYPEIIKYEDGYNQIYDSALLLNIYTIGYWKSIVSNRYEFIYSKSIIENNMRGINMASSGDDKPEKKLEDLKAKIVELYEKYKLPILSERDKEAYIIEYNGKNTNELNNKYNISGDNNSKIPEMIQEYSKVYKDFFGINLHDIINNTKRFYINIYNL